MPDINIIGEYNPTPNTGYIDTPQGRCSLENVVVGMADPVNGVRYTGRLRLQGVQVGIIEWRFGGSDPQANAGWYQFTNQPTYQFDCIEDPTAQTPQKPIAFIDKLP